MEISLLERKIANHERSIENLHSDLFLATQANTKLEKEITGYQDRINDQYRNLQSSELAISRKCVIIDDLKAKLADAKQSYLNAARSYVEAEQSYADAKNTITTLQEECESSNVLNDYQGKQLRMRDCDIAKKDAIIASLTADNLAKDELIKKLQTGELLKDIKINEQKRILDSRMHARDWGAA